MTRSARTWSVTHAKARFGELIEKARSEGPQTITRNGCPSATVLSPEEWERTTRRKGNLAEFFAKAPLRGADLDLDRLRDEPRDWDG